MKRYWLFALVAGLAILWGNVNREANAQTNEAFSEIQFLAGQHGVGVRALSMGGAFIGIADDYTASYWNPGGLAFQKDFEVYGSLSSNRARNNAQVFNSLSEVSQTFTKLNSFGFVAPVSVSRGGLSLAFGLNRTMNYNGVLSVRGFNDSPDNQIYQEEDITEEGGVRTATVAAGIEVAKGVGIGVALNVWFGSHEYNSIFSELDDLNIYTLDEYLTNQFIESKIRGIDLTFGVLYKPIRYIQLGLSMTTPQYFSITEEFVNTEDFYYDADSDLEDESYIDDGVFDYDVMLPYKFSFGIAFTSRFITLGGALEYRDWSQTRYLSEPPLDGLTRGIANRDIRLTVGDALTKRIGVEIFPGGIVSFRAGYSETPSFYKQAPNSYSRKNTSFGMGIRLADKLAFDITYLHSWWDSQTVDDLIESTVVEEKSENRILAGVSVSF